MLVLLQAVHPIDHGRQSRRGPILQALRQRCAADRRLHLLRRVRERPRRELNRRERESRRIRLAREERYETRGRFQWVQAADYLEST